MFEKLFKHNISKRNGQPYCCMCMTVLSNWEDAIHHIQGSQNKGKHKICKNDCATQFMVELENCSYDNYEVLVNNGIVLVNLPIHLRYTLWDKYLSSTNDILLQIKRKCLNNNLLAFDIKNEQQDTKETEPEHMEQINCSKSNTEEKKLVVPGRNMAFDAKDNAVIQEIHKLDSSGQRFQLLCGNKILITEQIYLKCIFCEQNFRSFEDTLQHIYGKSHNSVLKNECKLMQRVECARVKDVKKTVSAYSEGNTWEKKPGEQVISLTSTNMLSNSFEQEIHLFRNNQLLALGQIHMKCIICERSCQYLYDMLHHINATDHKNKLRDEVIKDKIDSAKIKDLTESVSLHSASSIQKEKLDMSKPKETGETEKISPICTSRVKNSAKQEMQLLQDSKIIAFGQTHLKCIVCERFFQSLHNILHHFNGKSHNSAFKNRMIKQDMDNVETEDVKATVALHSESSICKGKPEFSETKKTEQKQDMSLISTNMLNDSLKEEIPFLQDNEMIVELGLKQLKCTVCKRSFPSQHDIFHHFKGKQHKSMLENKDITKQQQTKNARKDQVVWQTSSSILQKNLEQEFQLLKDNTITMVGPRLECAVCKRKFPSVHDTLQHIRGRDHINKLQSKHTNVEIVTNKDTNNSATVDPKIKRKEQKLCLPETQNSFQDTNITLSQKPDTETPQQYNSCTNTNYRSNKSSMSMDTLNTDNETPHIESLLDNTHQTKYLMQDINRCENDKYSQNNIAIQDDFYYCDLCNFQSYVSNLIQHMAEASHANNESPVVLTEDDPTLFKCFCCKSIIPGCNQLKNHLRSKQHFENLKSFFCCIKHNSGNARKIITSVAHNTLTDKARFPLYTAIASTVENNSTRFTEQLVVSFDALHTKFDKDVEKHILYYCSVCKATIGTNHNLIEHCCGKRHMCSLIKQLSSPKHLQDSDSQSDTVSDSDDSHVETNLAARLATISIRRSDEQERSVKTVQYKCKIDTIPIKRRCEDHTIQTGSRLTIPSNVRDDIKRHVRISPIHFTSNKTKSLESKHEQLTKRLNKRYDLTYFELFDKIFSNDTAELLRLKSTYKVFVPHSNKRFYCLVCNEIVSKEIQTLYEHLHNMNHENMVCSVEKDNFTNQLLGEYMKKMSKNSIKCYPCGKCIDHSKTISHINSCLHKTKHAELKENMDDTFSSMFKEIDTRWYSIYRFCCLPCKSTFNYNIEFVQHVIKVHNMGRDSCKFDFCIPCATVWMCYENSYGTHCSADMHKYLVKTKFFAIESLRQCVTKLLMNIDKTVNNLFQLTEEVLLNDKIRRNVEKSLNRLRPRYPNLKVSFFGSRVTGLGFRNSDLDIYLDCGICVTNKNLHTHLMEIARLLSKQKKKWMVKEVLQQTRTPIIKLRHIPTAVECDISITSKVANDNSKFIWSFNDAYPLGRKLILFLKKWLQLCNLSGPYGVTSYTLVWLVLFYLQVKLHFPSFSELMKTENMLKCVNDWKTGVASSQNNLVSTDSISKLLLGFFNYYANFNYVDNIVCPLTGCELSKKVFVKPDELPDEMAVYIRDVQKSEEPEYFRIDSPFCVQDPFDLSHNLAKAVPTTALKAFKQYCGDSTYILNFILRNNFYG